MVFAAVAEDFPLAWASTESRSAAGTEVTECGKRLRTSTFSPPAPDASRATFPRSAGESIPWKRRADRLVLCEVSAATG